MDAVKHRSICFGSVREKSAAQDFLVKSELAMTSVSERICMSSSLTWTLLSVLISSGHIVRMVEDAPPRQVFDELVGGHRRVGRPRTRWKDQVGEALTSLGVTNWRRRAQSRVAWREALRQTETR